MFHIVHVLLVGLTDDTHAHFLNVHVIVLYVIALYAVVSALNVIVHHTATVHVVAPAFVLHHLFVNPSLVIVGAVTVQLVSLFQISQLSLLFQILVAQFLLYVIVGTLCVIALYVASALNVIVPFTATPAVCALALVFHHTIVNPSLVILGAVTVQLHAALPLYHV